MNLARTVVILFHPLLIYCNLAGAFGHGYKHQVVLQGRKASAYMTTLRRFKLMKPTRKLTNYHRLMLRLSLPRTVTTRSPALIRWQPEMKWISPNRTIIPHAIQTDSTVEDNSFNQPVRVQNSWSLAKTGSDPIESLFGNPLQLFQQGSRLSPKILSPSLFSMDNSGPTSAQLLSPALIALGNRTDALLKLPELLRDQPDLYAVAKELISQLLNDIKKVRLTQRDPPTQVQLKQSATKKAITWLRFKREPLTKEYAKTVRDFHRIWTANATLRNEWRQWYKANRQLTDQQLDELMSFKGSKRFEEGLEFEDIDCDFDHPNCPVIRRPFINDTERASNPLVVNPVIESPWVLSPYIFGPFILSPVILSPAVLSPNIFVPAILSPFLLSPFILSPVAFNPTILSPYVLTPLILSPAIFSPFILSPMVLSPCIVSPAALSPSILSPGVLNPVILCPSLFTELAAEQKLSPCVLCEAVLSPVHPPV